jgi:chromosome segregation protein
MRITHLACAGFRGVRRELHVDVPPGFLVVTGRNGTGKSSLCDILEYALTGQLRRQEGDTERQERIHDYVWWRGVAGSVEAYVSVGLEAESGQRLEVRRTPRGLETPQNEEQIWEFVCNVRRAPQEPMVRLLQTALIRDEEITRLSIDLSETQRFQFVRDAVGEADVSGYVEPLKDIYARLKVVAEESEKAYSSARDKVASALTQISEKRARLASDQEVADAERLLRERVQMTAGETMVAAGRRHLVLLRQRIADAETVARRLAAHEERRSSLQSDEFRERGENLLRLEEQARISLEQATQARQTAEDAIQAMRAQQPDMTAWAQILEHGRALGRRGDQCPLCGSTVDEHSFDTHIGEASATIARANDAMNAAAAHSAATAASESRARAALAQAEAMARTHVAATTELDRERAEISAELQKQGFPEPTEGELAERIDEWKSEARDVDRAILYLEASGGAADVERMERDLRELRTTSTAVQARLAQARAQMKNVKTAVDGLRRIEGEIIEERLAALGPLLEELYLRLRPHLDWPAIRYHIRGDTRRFLSLKVGDELNPRFMFSSGQRRAMGIAFLFAVHLSTDWSRLRMVALDDPVQHIDDFRALHLVELLSGLRKTGWQVVCTAEDPELAHLMVRRLRGLGNQSGGLVTLAYEPGGGVIVKETAEYPPVDARIIRSA